MRPVKKLLPYTLPTKEEAEEAMKKHPKLGMPVHQGSVLIREKTQEVQEVIAGDKPFYFR